MHLATTLSLTLLTFTVHQRFLEGGQLHFAQLDLVQHLATVDDQLGLHVDEIVVVGVRVHAEMLLQDATNDAAAPIDVLFQAFRLIQLLDQPIALDLQRLLHMTKRNGRSAIVS